MPGKFTIVVTGLSKAYRAGSGHCVASVEVLRSVSFSVRPSELVTVEGARGSGKTTLLRCASGLLRPDSGSVQWPSLPKRDGTPSAAIATVADRGPLHAFLTVRESIGYAAAVRETHNLAAASDTGAILDLAGLRYVEDLRVGILGSSERARLLVALGLVAAPGLLLIDDVDGGSDAVGRAAFARFLVRVAATGTAIVWAGRAVGAVAGATAAYVLENCALRPNAGTRDSRAPRRTLELDVPAAGKAAAMLAPSVPVVECRGPRVRVPLDSTTAEEVLAICRDLAIPVHASRVVREP